MADGDDLVGVLAGAPKLNRSRWHSPLVSVVVTHHNYADHVEGALLSLLDQSHQNWECVVVDDASTPEHREGLEEIVAAIGCPKIRVVQNRKNLGQVASFYVGIDNTSGDFVVLLDPDDRYAEAFLAEAVGAHLDDTFMCPLVCTDQYTVTEHGLMTGTYMGHLGLRRAEVPTTGVTAFVKSAAPDLIFFPPSLNNWLWSSTSAILYRRPVLKYLRPNRPLAFRRAADAYLASGAHMLGGTLLVPKPLVYRGLHSRNAFLTLDLFSMDQSRQRAGAEQWSRTARRDVVEAMFQNGVAEIFDAAFLSTVLKSHFSEDDLELLRAASGHVAALVPPPVTAPPHEAESAPPPELESTHPPGAESTHPPELESAPPYEPENALPPEPVTALSPKVVSLHPPEPASAPVPEAEITPSPATASPLAPMNAPLPQCTIALSAEVGRTPNIGESFLARRWRRLRKSSAKRWASATRRWYPPA